MLFIVVTAVLHFGGNHIYHWLEPGIMTEGSDNYDAIIAGKEPYLNATFFLIRSFIYVIIWIYCARRLRQISIESDLEGGIGEKIILERIKSFWLVYCFLCDYIFYGSLGLDHVNRYALV